MNFFRSEEHLRRWEGFEEKKKGGMISLDSLMQLFARPYAKNRATPDYVSRYGEYMADLIGELDRLPNPGDFWKLSPLIWVVFQLFALFIPMQFWAPSGPLIVVQHGVQIIPNVAGEVTEVPVEPNVPLKKGDVLFRIDPPPTRRPSTRSRRS